MSEPLTAQPPEVRVQPDRPAQPWPLGRESVPPSLTSCRPSELAAKLLAALAEDEGALPLFMRLSVSFAPVCEAAEGGRLHDVKRKA